MRRIAAIAVLLMAVPAGVRAFAAEAQTPSATAKFKRGTIEAKSWGGPIQGQGPWEFSGEVKLTTADLTMTCDRLKVWLTSDSRDWERVEASGKIEIRGKYVAADRTEWRVNGKAAAASYDAKAGEGVMKGSVDFKATNLATGATISAVADKLIYDVKTRQFRFERGERPVRVEWEQPAEKGPSPGAAAEPQGKGEEGK